MWDLHMWKDHVFMSPSFQLEQEIECPAAKAVN